MTFKIPQGGHSVIAAVTAASLMLIGAAAFTMVLETPLTQALAAAAPADALATRPAVVKMATDQAPDRAKLARCACARWRRAAANPAAVHCAVDELVISADWAVARLDLHDPSRHDAAAPDAVGREAATAAARADFHAVEVMHLIDGHVDEDWHLASTRQWR